LLPPFYFIKTQKIFRDLKLNLFYKTDDYASEYHLKSLNNLKAHYIISMRMNFMKEFIKKKGFCIEESFLLVIVYIECYFNQAFIIDFV